MSEDENENTLLEESIQEEVNTNTKEFKEVKEVAIAKLDDLSNSQEIYNLAKVLCESKLLPVSYNTPEKAIVAIAQGRELGLGALTSLYNLYFIQGKPVLSVHAINALITSKGIACKTKCDLESYTIKKTDGTTINDKKTTIIFYRKHAILNMVLEEEVTVTLREMKTAGLLEKDNWQKYPKQMLWNRCFTFGARRIASDILLGVMEVSEAGDTFNKNYSVAEDGNAKFDNYEEVK